MTYIIGEEDAIVSVLVDVVDPGVADEVDSALAGEILNGDALEEELVEVPVLHNDGPWDSLALVVLEGHVELGLAGDNRGQVEDALLQVGRLPYHSSVAVVCVCVHSHS